MARVTRVELTDDMNGQPGAEAIEFGLDGRIYDIDLAEENAAELWRLLAPFIQVARPRRIRKHVKNGHSGDAHLIRAWAAENGMPVAERGRISTGIRQAYRAAVAA